MKTFIFRVHDTLFLRGPSQFGAGEDKNSVATKTYSLPLPHTVLGALRYFSPEEIGMWGKDEDMWEHQGEWEIVCISWWQEGQPYLPWPANLTNLDGNFWEIDYETPNNEGILIAKKGGKKKVAFKQKKMNAFMPWNALKKWLLKGIPPSIENSIQQLIEKERRIGIQLEGGNAKKGHLYHAVHVRPYPETKLAITLKNFPDLHLFPKTIFLGGESRIIELKDEKEADWLKEWEDEWKSFKNENGKFFLYLVSPIISRYNDLSNELEKIGLKLKAIVGQKPFVIGGRKIGKKASSRGIKPLQYVIPAGNILFVNGHVDKPYFKLGKWQKVGYGLVLVGKR